MPYDSDRYSAHPLKLELETARRAAGLDMQDLTVLDASLDPYRLFTPAIIGAAEWLAEKMADLRIRVIHPRGLHYRLLASTALTPDGERYVNTEEDYLFLCRTAKQARWLGLIPFSAITDERNADPVLKYVVPKPGPLAYGTVPGASVYVPSLDDAMPGFGVSSGFTAYQPYRLILLGEKTSLQHELESVAQTYGAELLLPSGEISETLIYNCAKRAAEDGRPAVLFYFSDFDPSGNQMPCSVARKFQAHKAREFHDLDIQVHHIGLKLPQVEHYNLPGMPIGKKEKRAAGWEARYGDRGVIEIDALLGGHPGAVAQLARDAIRPFYDPTLAERVGAAKEEWEDAAADALDGDHGYMHARAIVRLSLQEIQRAVSVMQEGQQMAEEAMQSADLPKPQLPEPELHGEQPEPLFTTSDDYVTATRKLMAYRVPGAGQIARAARKAAKQAKQEAARLEQDARNAARQARRDAKQAAEAAKQARRDAAAAAGRRPRGRPRKNSAPVEE